ncbi:hypothetical protein HYDPIDRAFT_31785 [Hydnomerulius pinastri MD-312]|uniref:Unplaced genomic scaffold scaffold_33, whole genome shotgun sequence n=1 Tax=Hydnomerulius pinastri MD-312 TaxID=994086 RepID=A0A0C9WBK4_9AGAM|nr:hypothetical protein HYDPIDRAFT_31785 [Hydnomerulius pinastri MD-312]
MTNLRHSSVNPDTATKRDLEHPDRPYKVTKLKIPSPQLNTTHPRLHSSTSISTPIADISSVHIIVKPLPTMLAYDTPGPAYPSLNDYHFPNSGLVSFSNDAAPVYDTRGRQKHFVESSAQRRERIEFLKRREWARRVAEWVRETSSRKDVTTFGCSRPFPSSPVQEVGFKAQIYSTPQASVIPFPQVEEEEPYIIYSSSPTSSLSSLSEDTTPILPINGGSPSSINFGVGGISQPPQKRSSGHHRRCSSASLRGHTRRPSLSSIFEVPEED